MKTNFNTILEDVTKQLNIQLPKYLTYHNTAHTLYVLKKAIDIAEKENVSNEDLKLIKIAALYHDIGFIIGNIDHERKGCKIAHKQLKEYGYSKEDIDTVCGIIMATKIPQNPQNLLEQIVADADLEYLATSKFETVSELLFEELKHYNQHLTRDEWNAIQISFITKHRYHTKFCKHYKSHRKQRNIELLKNQVD